MPARLRDLKRAAKRWNIELSATHSGRHPFKFVRTGRPPYPVKAHNGERSELADAYVRGLARHFDIDERELFNELRGVSATAAAPEPIEIACVIGSPVGSPVEDLRAPRREQQDQPSEEPAAAAGKEPT
jgi:hypothetical protein